VGEDRKRRCVEKLGVEALVDDRHDRAHGVAAAADAFQDRLLAHAPVQQVGLHQAPRLLDLPAVSWEIDAVIAVDQLLQRAQEVAHIALGRPDDTGVPAHHVVA